MMNIKRFYKKMNIIIKVINYENIHLIHPINTPIKYFLIRHKLKILICGYNIHPLNIF